MAETPDGDNQEKRYSEAEANEIASKAISKRVNEVTQSMKAENQTALNALRAELTPSKPAEKVWTRAELNQAVKDKTITQEAGQAIFDKQQTQHTEQLATSIATRTVENLTRTNVTQASIDKYKDHDPELSVTGSDSRDRITKEVQSQMRNLGVNESTLGIELNALRTVYGPEESLGGSEHSRQTHQDISGSGDPGSENKDGKPEGLSKRESDYYSKGIEAGRYANWAAVTKELENANPDVRRRAAAR